MARVLEVTLPEQLNKVNIENLINSHVGKILRQQGVRLSSVAEAAQDNIIDVALSQSTKSLKTKGILWKPYANPARAYPTLESLSLEDEDNFIDEEYIDLDDAEFESIQQDTIDAVFTAVESASFFVAGSIVALAKGRK